LTYSPFGGVVTSGWTRIARAQHATSQKVAVFTHREPVGEIQQTWFLDSEASGGLTWIYDPNYDQVVNVANPPDPSSFSWTPPLTVGTAITDHYARFRSPSSFGVFRGGAWVYQWDDDTRSWKSLVADDVPGGITMLAHAPVHDTSVGKVGPSRLWAAGGDGHLYVLSEKPVVK
jgi:hypothetical protein